jgi:hypothetical protein
MDDIDEFVRVCDKCGNSWKITFIKGQRFHLCEEIYFICPYCGHRRVQPSVCDYWKSYRFEITEEGKQMSNATIELDGMQSFIFECLACGFVWEIFKPPKKLPTKTERLCLECFMGGFFIEGRYIDK